LKTEDCIDDDDNNDDDDKSENKNEKNFEKKL